MEGRGQERERFHVLGRDRVGAVPEVAVAHEFVRDVVREIGHAEVAARFRESPSVAAEGSAASRSQTRDQTMKVRFGSLLALAAATLVSSAAMATTVTVHG